jgi:hypothetical protein
MIILKLVDRFLIILFSPNREKELGRVLFLEYLAPTLNPP